ncbi:MAG: TonB-dependent receptor [Bacteroidetes bacterium]|nr:TonB-dependent receptor [Bacteroidota bacterium]
MRHLTLLFVLTLFSFFTLWAQTGSIEGKIVDSESAKPIEGVYVRVDGVAVEAYSNNEGEYVLNEVPVGTGKLIFTSKNYEQKILEFKLSAGETLQLGTTEIVTTRGRDYMNEELPMVTLEESDLDDDETQPVSGLLHSSDDVFSEITAYTFGAVRYRARGYDSENTAIYFNGIEMNDIETGRPNYGNWGGINDVLRNKEIFFGQENNDLTLSFLGGGANILTKASAYRPGVKVSYMNRLANYKNRVMATASTGLMDNGWAFTVSGSHRWAEEGYVEGTDYDAWAYFFAAEKRIGAHTLNLTAFATPNKRGKLIGSTQEAYDLAGSNYYNANWGYQAGEVRNARVADDFKPYIMLNYEWDINSKMDLATTVSYSFGRDGNTALNWGDAPDPRPNYYRNLPYYNRDDPFYDGWNQQQVDWDGLYFANSDEYFVVEDVDGIDGNDIGGIRSKYMVENRRIDHNQISANVKLNYELTKDLNLMADVNYTNYVGRHYKEVSDLLGGEYWLDIDKFAEGDVNQSEGEQQFPDYVQIDLNNPNRLAKEGDVFGYDYDANIQKISGFVKGDYTLGNLDLYLGLGLVNTSFYRTGNMQVGKYPDQSFGDSEKQTFLNYNATGGLTYKITGRHIVYANAAYLTRAPYFEDAYVSPRTRDHVVDGLTDETIMSFDVNYMMRLPRITGRFSAFYTTFQDQIDVMSFYHDDYKSFVNYAMTGIDKKHFGIELGLEGEITSTITATGAVSLGQYTWDSRPKVSITRDNDSESLATNEVVYVKDYRVDGTPQTALNFGLEYRAPKYWFVAGDINYFDNTYLSFNPARRTTQAVQGLDLDSDLADQILSQERLPSSYTVNLKAGKSWRFDRYYVSLFAVVNNVLDNQEIITGGYEQLRFDYENKDVNKYPANYFYMYGRTYMLILTLALD